MGKELIVLGKWEQAKKAVAECKSVDELKQIRDKAQALKAYAKQAREGLEVQNNIADIKLRAERKIGEFSSVLLKKDNQWSPHDGKGNILKEAGITHSERYEAIASLPEKEFEGYLQRVKDSNEELTTVGVIKLAKQLIRNTNIKHQKEDIKKGINLPKGKFENIVIDPPWAYGTGFDPDSRRVANPYPEMSIDSLKELKIPHSDNSILWLWTTHKFIWEARELMDYWGFDYKGILTWNKEKMGMGAWFRMQCEFCLLGIKGKPIWDINNLRDIISEPRREHSRKPEAFYKMIDDNFVGRKLDWFGQQQRKGWTIYGNNDEKYG